MSDLDNALPGIVSKGLLEEYQKRMLALEAENAALRQQLDLHEDFRERVQLAVHLMGFGESACISKIYDLLHDLRESLKGGQR